MSAPRDPRIDPKVGDVLARRYERDGRTVTLSRTVVRQARQLIGSEGKVVLHWVVYIPDSSIATSCQLNHWQRWAMYAEVLNTAEAS